MTNADLMILVKNGNKEVGKLLKLSKLLLIIELLAGISLVLIGYFYKG